MLLFYHGRYPMLEGLTMNAAEKINNLTTASKIGAIVNLFKRKFPAVTVDLKPWLKSTEMENWLDPYSLDLGFHFPGISRLLQARSILFQIRLHQDLTEPQNQPPQNQSPKSSLRAVGIEALGYNYRGQCWYFSTIDQWTFYGEAKPIPEGEADFKEFCQLVLQTFWAE